MLTEETKTEALSELETSAITSLGYNSTIPFIIIGINLAEQALRTNAELGLYVIAALTAANMILEYQALKRKKFSINILTTLLHRRLGERHPMVAIGLSKAASIALTIVNPIDPSSWGNISHVFSGNLMSVGPNAMIRDVCVEVYNTVTTTLLLLNRIDPLVNGLSRLQGKLPSLRNGNGRR